MAAGGEDAHVGADLSDDHLGVAAADTGDRLEQRQRRRERGDLLLDPVRAGTDRLVQVVEVGEDLGDEEGVVAAEARLQGAPEGGQLGAQPSFG